jgi:hypothetical protein
LAITSYASQWDTEILDVKLQNVHIEAESMESAWIQIGTQCLLRANFWADLPTDVSPKKFVFDKPETTGRDLITACIGAYPNYTFTQDSDTGVLWIHPKTLKYSEILSKKAVVSCAEHQVQVFSSIYIPLNDALSPFIQREPSSLIADSSLFFAIDLSPGAHSAKQLINECCDANPVIAFKIAPFLNRRSLKAISFGFASRVAPPRSLAVDYWKKNIGDFTNKYPSASEIGSSMAAFNFKKRQAARSYYEATQANYRPEDIVSKSGNPENTVWAALGIKSIAARAFGDAPFLKANAAPGFATNLTQISDPRLALITLLELAREHQDTARLEMIVHRHEFTTPEIESIAPDVYRVIRMSAIAREKMLELKLNIPEFSPDSVKALENGKVLQFDESQR